jgi:hypothetical protein
VALLVSLPLALWNPGAFIHDVILLQFRQPLRPDALSYLNLFPSLASAAGWLSLLLILPTLAWVLRREQPGPAGFARGAALVLLVFFAFNKQAFCNYYYLVVGTLCLAAGAQGGISMRSHG